MGGSSGEEDSLDGGFAFWAGGVCFSIDLEHIDERPSIAVGVLEIPEGRPASGDGFFEDSSDGVEKFRRTSFSEQS